MLTKPACIFRKRSWIFPLEPIVLNGANFLNSQREFYTMHSSSDACRQRSILLVMVEREPHLTSSPWPGPGPGPLPSVGEKGRLHSMRRGLPLQPFPGWRFLGEAQLFKTLWTPRGDHKRTILGRLWTFQTGMARTVGEPTRLGLGR